MIHAVMYIRTTYITTYISIVYVTRTYLLGNNLNSMLIHIADIVYKRNKDQRHHLIV